MIQEKEKILIILGPTATGKSDIAVKIAKKLNGEIISADSRQVYKGLDIGTGKITKEEMDCIPHHLLDIKDPRDSVRYTAKQWADDAREKITRIIARGKLPIICGGTGFYISALLGEVKISDVEPNSERRSELESKSIDELVAIYKNLNGKREIDFNNKIKIIRAIEILESKDEGTTHVEGVGMDRGQSYDAVKIGLSLPDDVLRQKIHDRLLKRLDATQNNGTDMLDEAKRLIESGLTIDRMKELGLEYRYLAMHIDGELSKEEMIKILETKIWQYARRQKTWFRRFKDIRWIDPRNESELDQALVSLGF